MNLDKVFNDIAENALKNDAPEYFSFVTKYYTDPIDRAAFQRVIDKFPRDLKGKTVVDFGSKYGHSLVLYAERGAEKAIGFDIREDYVEDGNKYITPYCPEVSMVMIEDCLIPLQPQSVDLVVLNEVISHINPAYLETAYREVARILRPGGQILISDGNNFPNALNKDVLPKLYEAWERGEKGTETDRDKVKVSYEKMRVNIIATEFPELMQEDVLKIAKNTSGLFGDQISKVVKTFIDTGVLVKRPFQAGVFPVCPEEGGMVMERAFYPEHVMMSLEAYGLTSEQLFQPAKAVNQGLKGFVFNLLVSLRTNIMRNFFRRRLRDESQGFVILATKVG